MDKLHISRDKLKEHIKSNVDMHCQNGRADICYAGRFDGICCPEDSCDIDDGVRTAPKDKTE